MFCSVIFTKVKNTSQCYKIHVTFFTILIQPSDAQRTVPINCGYIGTNDYTIETGDREFMLRVRFSFQTVWDRSVLITRGWRIYRLLGSLYSEGVINLGPKCRGLRRVLISVGLFRRVSKSGFHLHQVTDK